VSKPHITTESLAAGIKNESYSQSLSVVGGNSPYTWAAKNLPSGLSLKSSNIVGTPTAIGTNSVTLEVKDNMSQTTTATLTLTVEALLKITTTALPNAVPGQAYSFQLASQEE
jgi:hypothetical protein